MDVWEYFASRERECAELSLYTDGDFSETCAAEEGSDGRRGIIFGNFALTERAYLAVSESVVVEGSGVHREEYSYYLVFDGMEMWGFDRDLSHNPVEHGHVGQDHTRVEAGRVTFREVVERAWDTVSEEEALAPDGGAL